MTVKVKYNPSTGKVAYNPATGKVQMYNNFVTAECAQCTDIQPGVITATFSDIADIPGCCDMTGSYKDMATSGLAVMCNGLWTVPLSSGCTYYTSITGSWGTRTRYDSIDGSCASVISTDNYDKLELIIYLSATNVTVIQTAWWNITRTWQNTFYAIISCDGEDVCANGATLEGDSNIISSCRMGPSSIRPAWKGSVVVVFPPP